MATREKTVRYAFPVLTAVADATVTNFTRITIAIPESSVTFLSVQLQWYGNDTLSRRRAGRGRSVVPRCGSARPRTSRAGNGAFSFAWGDDTETVFVSCREDSTHLGRSEDNTAT